MTDVKALLRPWFNKIRYPKVGSTYYILTRQGIYAAPSIRQASILRRYIKANWALGEHDMVRALIAAEPITQVPIILDVGGNIGYSANAYSKMLNPYDGL